MSALMSVGAYEARDLIREPAAERAKLEKVAEQLEAQFMRHLLQALRDTVPEGSSTGGMGQAKTMFTEILDEQIAEDLAGRLQKGVGEAIYRELARSAGLETESPKAPPTLEANE